MMIVERQGFVSNWRAVVIAAVLMLFVVRGMAVFALMLTLHVPQRRTRVSPK